MAEIKKYLDTTALGTLVDQIKAEDAKVLQGAKDYADGLAKNYDAAGAAGTAEANAKAYTDELANGAVADNAAAIEKLNGDATTDGSVAKAIADAKSVIDGDIDAVETKADAAQAAADAAQGEVDALETYVGTIPETATATDIVGYVQEKTAGIATSENLQELTNRVAQAETDIDNIEKDYLKAADKTELQGAINGVAEDVATISGDYLKGADKTELEGKIGAKADQTALDAEVEAREGAIEGLQTQINTIMNNPDAEGAINSINEFTQYIADHGTIADGFRTDIDKNKEDIAAEAKRAGEAEAALDGRLDALEAIDHNAYVAADTALETKLNGEIAKKVDTTTYEAAIEALEGVDAGQETRIKALEAKFGEGEGNVEAQIATAKQEAIDAAATDATTKANAAETAAKGHADSLNTAMNTRVEALEAVDHEHANKAELDLIATGDKAKWDAAAAKAHEHANQAELDKVANGDVAKWNAAEQNAKTYADGLNTAMTTKVDGVDARVKTLEETIVDKAEADDLDAAVERIAANEAAIAANTSAINSFTAITSDEVNALFA